MNKKLLLGLLLVLLLLSCLAMADGCETCGDNPVFADDAVAVAVDSQTHTKTCIHGVTYTFSHSYPFPTKENYKSDSNRHWLECSECDATINAGNHWTYCDNPNVCAECGVDYSGSTVQHHYNSNYEFDSDFHWFKCTSCGADSNKSMHYTYCDKPTICAGCGVYYSSNKIQHHYNGSYEYDSDYHWLKCTNCGDTLDRIKHYAYCNKPTICAACGVDYSGNNLQHKYNIIIVTNMTLTNIGRYAPVAALLPANSSILHLVKILLFV